MSIESRTGAEAPGLVQGYEGVAVDGRRTYTIPFAHRTGSVVFRGRAAEAASLLLGLGKGATFSQEHIRETFNVGIKGIQTFSSAAREGLRIAGSDAMLFTHEGEYSLVKRTSLAKGESRLLKGAPEFEIDTQDGRVLHLVGERARIFDQLRGEPLSGERTEILPEEVERLQRILTAGETGIQIAERDGGYDLNVPTEQRINAQWVIDLDNHPSIRRTRVKEKDEILVRLRDDVPEADREAMRGRLKDKNAAGERVIFIDSGQYEPEEDFGGKYVR